MRADVEGPLPGPEGEEIVEEDHRYLVTTTKHVPVVAERGEGCIVHDVDGNQFLDFTSGVGVTNTGHCHPRVVEAVQDQAEELMHFAGTDFYYKRQSELAHRLSDLTPVPGEPKAFLCNSGTESVEAALKMARWSTERTRHLGFTGAFHGRTLGSLSLTASKPVQRRKYHPMTPGATHAPFPNPYRNPWGIDGYEEPEALTTACLEFIEEQIFAHVAPPDEVAAVFFEPVQGEGGYVVPPDDFPSRLKALCEEHGIVLVADEVQAGFGRTGELFASEHFDVEPDIVTLAKAMGSGIPVGAAVCRRDLDFGVSGAHSTTYGGNLIACAAALATIDVIEDEGLVEQAQQRGEYLRQRLEELAEKREVVGDVRGLGLMQATDFVEDPGERTPDEELADAVAEEAYRRGLILLPAGASAIRFIPPLTVSEDQIDQAVEILDEAIEAAV